MRCIANYIKLNVILITVIFVALILTGVNLAYEGVQSSFNQDGKLEITDQIQEKTEEINIEEPIEEKNLEKGNKTTSVWQIEIPKINLIAPIAEGTSQDVMNEYVGHFENTSLWKGNIGLAAHNRRLSKKLF